MNFFPENYDATVTVPLTNGEGVSAIPSAATAIVKDAEGVEVVDLGSITLPGSGETVEIVIPGINNVLAVDEIRKAHVVIVTLTYPEGPVVKRLNYAIEKDIALDLMINSFMSYPTAEITALDFVNTIGWTVASEGQRKTALINAYNRLTQIPMKWNPRDADGIPDRQTENVIHRDIWPDIDSDAFALFPTHFKRALRRAQFVEANELLQGDTFSRKRRQGIIKETIGESDVELNSSILDLGVSSETLAALAGYVYFDLRIARA